MICYFCGKDYYTGSPNGETTWFFIRFNGCTHDICMGCSRKHDTGTKLEKLIAMSEDKSEDKPVVKEKTITVYKPGYSNLFLFTCVLISVVTTFFVSRMF